MDLLDQEILKLWKSLEANNVEYIMVGGFATNLHGFQRTTGDMDLWIRDSVENRKRLRAVLKEMDIGDFESIETTEFIPGWSTINLKSGFELDIMTSLKGFEQSSFDECYKSAPSAIIMDIPVKFLHINHLIQAKKATGRAKDQIDVLELERIRDGK